jgi:hypothetical protein
MAERIGARPEHVAYLLVDEAARATSGNRRTGVGRLSSAPLSPPSLKPSPGSAESLDV